MLQVYVGVRLQARTQGGSTNEPPFLAGYTYYLCDRLTLDDGLSSKDDG